jgi:hypothetical protein
MDPVVLHEVIIIEGGKAKATFSRRLRLPDFKTDGA